MSNSPFMADTSVASSKSPSKSSSTSLSPSLSQSSSTSSGHLSLVGERAAHMDGGMQVPVQQYGLANQSDADVVAIEEPLEVRLEWPTRDGITRKSIAVTMRTPGHDLELTLGFLFTEGILLNPAEVSRTSLEGNVATVILLREPSVALEMLERNTYVSSSCGICGKASIDAIATTANYSLPERSPKFSAASIANLPELLSGHQKIFAGTGGIHAAALFNGSGLLGQVFEDVGRHNAVDKLIGARFLAKSLPLKESGMLVSGRASFELVQKARMSGCAILAAVGAPSSLAIELAWESNMTLIGFLRDGRFNIYSGPFRVE